MLERDRLTLSNGPELTRRALTAGACCAATLRRASARATPKFHAADHFVDSVGLCTHIDSEPYADHAEDVIRTISALGVRHLRDEVRPTNDLRQWRRLRTEAGLRWHLLVSPATNTIPEMVAFLQALGPGAVSAVEGQNEGDSPWFRSLKIAKSGWADVVLNYQRAVFETLRSGSQTRGIPVVSPSVLDYRPNDMRMLRPAAAFCDIVSLHAYAQRQQEPETSEDYASLTWYLRNIRDVFKPQAPTMVTETGYETGAGGISDQAAAAYLPRLLLHFFDHGVVRTFLYELMDEGVSGDPEQSYGLITARAVPKPAFHALKLLLGALTDPGSTFTPAATALTVEEAAGDLRLVHFAKRSGESVIALWRAVRVWDPATRTDVTVAPAPIRLRVPPAAEAAMLRLDEGSAWSRLDIRDGRLSTELAGQAVLLRLSAP